MTSASRLENDLEVSYVGEGQPWLVTVPAEAVGRLLQPFGGTRRAYLAALLNGKSKSAAAAAAGITTRCAQYWTKRDQEFARAVETAAEVGFSTVIEAELYNRALAGRADRGSMRALELVVKSRAPAYRERSQAQLDVVRHAQEALQRLAQGWDQADDEVPCAGPSPWPC
jgi:hypothetical protein